MEILDFEFEDDVFYLRLETEYGLIEVVAEARQQDRVLHLDAFHIDGPGPNAIGVGALIRLAKEFAAICLEHAHADELVIQGFQRSTGAHPGRIPGLLRFRR